MLAEILLARSEYSDAVFQLLAAVEADPDHEGAVFNLAQLLRGTGRLEEALPHYERARQLNRQMARASHGHAVTLLWLGRYREAQASLDQALGWMPGHPDLVLLQSRFLAASPDGDLRDGAAALELSKELFADSESLSVAETVAMAYAELGRFDEAAAWQESALETALQSGRQHLVRLVRHRLDLYQSGRPCRERWLRGEAHCPFSITPPRGS